MSTPPRLLSNPWEKYVTFGLNGNAVISPETNKVNKYAAEQPSITHVWDLCFKSPLAELGPANSSHQERLPPQLGGVKPT